MSKEQNSSVCYCENNRNQRQFIKVDDDRLINYDFIRWIQKKDECFKICTKMDGCVDYQTHSVCKNTNSESYFHLLRILNKD